MTTRTLIIEITPNTESVIVKQHTPNMLPQISEIPVDELQTYVTQWRIKVRESMRRELSTEIDRLLERQKELA